MPSTTTTIPATASFDALKCQKAVEAILAVLRKNTHHDDHQKALQAFEDNDMAAVKLLAATHLDDSLFRALVYLASALKLTPNTVTILAEAARAAADFTKESSMKSLSSELSKVL